MASSLPYSGGQGDNNNVEGEETFEKGRKNYAKNLMPVNVRTLLQHQEPGEPLVVHGQAVGMVSLVGQVRQVTKGTVSLSYLPHSFIHFGSGQASVDSGAPRGTIHLSNHHNNWKL